MKRNWLVLFLLACLANFASADDTFFDSNGVKIHYVTSGAGEAVVLVHGWMGDSSMWGRDAKGNTKLTNPPDTKLRLIALDCRGHGLSDKPHDQEQYGAEMAWDVVRLLDHLKIKKAHLIGYSMGAFIVGKVAASYPDRVLSVIYGGQAPLIPIIHPAGSREIQVFAKAVDDGKGLGPYLIETSQVNPKTTLDQANNLAKYIFGTKDVKAFAESGLSFKGLEVAAADLRKCKAPALFIYGGNETDWARADIENVRKVIGPSSVKIVEGANHVTTPRKAEFGAAIVKFLSEHARVKSDE